MRIPYTSEMIELREKVKPYRHLEIKQLSRATARLLFYSPRLQNKYMERFYLRAFICLVLPFVSA